jgi:hypothetical protein
MALDFDHDGDGGRMDVDGDSCPLAGGSSRPLEPGGYLVTIGLGGSLERPRLTGSAGAVLPACEPKFGVHLKEAGFDRAGTPKSPQQAC